jgi:uncharacterized protein involved in exopolysaccharide biosynthesis
MSSQEPDTIRRQISDDEINLVDLFLMVWKRKWMIVAVTLLVTSAAAGLSLVQPEVYEITAILVPAKDSKGKLVENPQAIRENIVNGSYDRFLAEELDLPLEKIPAIKVAIPKDTDLVKISVESSDPERAVLVVDKVLKGVDADIQKLLDLEIKLTKNRITEAQLEDESLVEQIKLINKQITQFESIVSDMEKERKEALANPHSEAMAVLLYSNEVKNQQIYLNALQEKLEDLKKRKRQIAITIDNIRLELEGMRGTVVSNKPVIPEMPLKPKKALIVALAFVLGLMGSIMLTFIVEFINKVRQQQKS